MYPGHSLFAFAAVTVGLLAARGGWADRTGRFRGFVTAVAAFGLGLASYAVAYALAG
jgi:hypothetical protein